ncbi:MAG: response regulator [Magnetovibrio sp.]|nr:response regulator [Magnetovibrio sp.]
MKPPKHPEFRDLDVLICDDDTMVLQLIEHILKDLGIGNITTTDSPKTALRLLREPVAKPFDMFLCDWMMPEMSGIDVLKKVREWDLGVSFVMLTAKTTSDDVTEARELGVDLYIAKPFTADQVQQKIAVVGRRLLNRE